MNIYTRSLIYTFLVFTRRRRSERCFFSRLLKRSEPRCTDRLICTGWSTLVNVLFVPTLSSPLFTLALYSLYVECFWSKWLNFGGIFCSGDEKSLMDLATREDATQIKLFATKFRYNVWQVRLENLSLMWLRLARTRGRLTTSVWKPSISQSPNKDQLRTCLIENWLSSTYSLIYRFSGIFLQLPNYFGKSSLNQRTRHCNADFDTNEGLPPLRQDK